MSRILKEYTILISCPSDIKKEKKIVENIIEKFNRSQSYNYNVIFRCVEWKLGTYSSVGKYPQEQINQQIVDQSDMAIAIFWNRAGEATKKSISGTVEEIDRLCKQDKQVFLYFSLRETTESKKIQQLKKVKEIKDKYKNKSIYKEYMSLKEFENIFEEEFNIFVAKNIKNEKELVDKKVFSFVPVNIRTLKDKISQANHSIFLSGASLISTLSTSFENCENLEYIHILMTEEEESIVAECAKLSYASKDELLKHIATVKQHFSEMKVLDNMEIKCINAVMPCSLVGIDIEKPNGMIFVRQYLYGQNPTACPHYVCYFGEKWFNVYKEQMDSLWKDGKPIDIRYCLQTSQ